ncbi:MAG: outer membrane protein assembly factor BamD [Phycisphaerales bacterium]|nr:outer membrane protein assembly factor BamD [Phycisphaerales bacterium]
MLGESDFRLATVPKLAAPRLVVDRTNFDHKIYGVDRAVITTLQNSFDCVISLGVTLQFTLVRFMPRLALAFTVVALLTSSAYSQETLKLSADDRWMPPADSDPASTASQLRQAQLALARGDASRASNLVAGWLDRYPADPLRAHALLLKGDSLLAQGDEYKALYDYEELVRLYPGSDVFVTALQREFQIAKAYSNGLRRKFFGTFRWLNAEEEAEELLIRIQERLPGSELAEQAGMELADFYFRKRDLQLAADAYDLFVQNYPKSRQVEKARLRLIYSLCAAYRGPLYDARGLFEASALLRQLQALDPITAQRVGADALLIRIYESEASKLLSEAGWYQHMDDPISCELYIRRLIGKFPKSIATLVALREIPTVVAELPAEVRASCPDYHALRKQLLGLDWDTSSATPTEVPAALPAAPATTTP